MTLSTIRQPCLSCVQIGYRQRSDEMFSSSQQRLKRGKHPTCHLLYHLSKHTLICSNSTDSSGHRGCGLCLYEDIFIATTCEECVIVRIRTVARQYIFKLLRYYKDRYFNSFQEKFTRSRINQDENKYSIEKIREEIKIQGNY